MDHAFLQGILALTEGTSMKIESVDMDVLILGLNHQIQSAHIKNMSTDGSAEAFERTQKEALAQLVYDVIHQRAIEFVAEETKHGEDSIALRDC
jgi:hypothetical protein